MNAVTTLIERNQTFSKERHQARPPLPTLNTIVLSCMDARTDPAHFLGLEPGEALVVRNSGGRVTPAVEEELAMLVALATKMGAPPPQVVVVHHTQCGMQRLADPSLRAGLSAAAAVDPGMLEHLAIHDHAVSLKTDCAKLLERLPAGIRVVGLVFDAETGTVRTEVDEIRS